MLKHQVRTLNRERKPRKSVHQLFDTSLDDSNTSTTSTDGSGSPALGMVAPRGCRLKRQGRSTSFSSLSSSSSNSVELESGTIRVYTYAFRADSDYKTLFVTTGTTAEDVINMLLAKFRCRLKDPQLYFITMEVFTKHSGEETKNLIVLDAKSRPLELQLYQPNSRFVLQASRGSLVKIHDACLDSQSVYKGLMISESTTCNDAIQMILQAHKRPVSVGQYELVVVDSKTGCEYVLRPEERLLIISEEEWFDEYHQFHLRHARKFHRIEKPIWQQIHYPVAANGARKFPLPAMSLADQFNSYCVL